MDKLAVIAKIGTILSDLKEQQEYFENNLQSLNEVEVELFAASASYLAEYAKVLKKFPVNPTGARIGTSQATTAHGDRPAVQSGGESEADSSRGLNEYRFTEDTQKIQQPGASEVREPRISEEPLADELRRAAETHSDDTESESESDILNRPVAEGGNPSQTGIGSGPDDGPAAAPSERLPDDFRERVPDATPPVSSPDASFTPAPDVSEHPEPPRKLSLNERFGEKRSTLYERIVSARSRPEAYKSEEPANADQRFSPEGADESDSKPILNLGRSIGINERYYFIKTLFQNDKVAFDQAITRIDMCHSLGEALEYTNRSLAGKYNWSRKEEDARKFYDLLKRRFT